MDDLSGFEHLVAIMDRLRDPGGCPWDHQQDYESLRRYLIEECYEVAEALDHRDPGALCEELGDLLFQIVFLSRLAKEDGDFTIDDVIRGISRKMIRRHPHVFASVEAETAEQVVRNWEEIKREEKGGKTSFLDGIPSHLPGMLKAGRLGKRAAEVGFDWEHAEQILDKAREELDELGRAVGNGDKDEVRAEIGDLLFTLVMLSRRLEIDPEGALERTNLKFRERFRWMEDRLRERGIPLDEAGPDLMESLWEQSKRAG